MWSFNGIRRFSNNSSISDTFRIAVQSFHEILLRRRREIESFRRALFNAFGQYQRRRLRRRIHWEEERLRVALLQRIFRLFRGRGGFGGGAPLLLGAVATAATGSSNIPDEMITAHMRDLEDIDALKEKTLTCPHCKNRHLIDEPVDGIKYCSCPHQIKGGVYGKRFDGVVWTPFLERKNVIVWRQEHPEQKGMYIYKMYGIFDDITADEFLAVSLDLSEFRLSWDSATAQCRAVEEERTDFATENAAADDINNSNNKGAKISWSMNQVYYWEVIWPKFFSNRDYVCNRRAVVNEKEKVMVIYSKATTHPECPVNSKIFRVEDYSSVQTIRPFTDFDRKGMEFSLTAFENPGVSLPSYITTWVAIRGMPDYMINLRRACLERRKWRPSSSSSSEVNQTSFSVSTDAQRQYVPAYA